MLNPKVALFYPSSLPQFIYPGAEGPGTQRLILGVTLNRIGILVNLMCVHFAASLTETLRESARISYWLNKALGSLFVLLGFRLAAERH